jgi:hypothetical protein
MIRDELSSIDLVELIMAIEESFEIEIPDQDAEAISGPREIVNWLTVHLAGKAMSDGAVLQLENLARQRRMPHLMQNFNRTWQPEQINAIVREILRVHGMDDWSDPLDPDISVRAPLKPRPHLQSGRASAVPDEQQ